MDIDYKTEPDALEFRHILETLFSLGISPKSSGLVYLLQFLMLTRVEEINANTYKETVKLIAAKNNTTTRIIEDNITLTLNHVWDRCDTPLFHEMFASDGKPFSHRRPWLREIAIMLLLFCEARENKDNIYAEFFGYCTRNGIELNF